MKEIIFALVAFAAIILAGILTANPDGASEWTASNATEWARTEKAIHRELTADARARKNPVDYIKDVAAYQEGDGIVVYFILADANGKMIAADGKKVSLRITDSDSQELYSTSKMYVTKKMFYKTTRGRGAFEEDVLLCTFGRIKFDSFFKKPEGLLNVSVSFETEDGRILEGETSTYV